MRHTNADAFFNRHQNATYNVGTTLLESLVVIQFPILIHFFVILLENTFIAPLLLNNHIITLFEFVVLVVPLTLFVTCLSEFTYVNYCISFVIIIGFIVFCLKDVRLTCVLHSSKYIDDDKNPFVTKFRALVNIFSVLCILAVDFNIFPKRFAKAEVRGYGLMDTGTGLYVVSNGLVTCLSKKPDLNSFSVHAYISLKKTLPLLLMGVGRFILVKSTNYHQNVSEYGIHWNFFITLAALKIFNGLLLPFLNEKRIYISAFVLVFIHQLILSCGVEEWIISDAPRENFIFANREGIFSVIGYEVLYLCGIMINNNLPKRGDYTNAYISVLKKSSILSVCFITFTKFCEIYIGVSRRTANFGYISWLLAIVFMITSFGVMTELFSYAIYDKIRNYNENSIPLMLKAVNDNGVLFFILANVITGIINISIDTSSVSHGISLVIIIIYMYICCYTVCFLYFKKLHIL